MIKTNIFKPKLLAKAVALASVPLLAFCASNVLAQENSDLMELKQLQERMEKLEKRLQDAVSTAPNISEESSDNKYLLRDGKGIKIGDTTISFGGFIKTDIIYGSNGYGTPNGYSIGLARAYAAAANSNKNNWKVGMTARESRISIGTKTDNVAGHDLTTYIEMDFNQAVDAPGNESVSNSYSPRLRQAFASWNNWDVGQTYSTFTDLAVMPEILGQGKQAAFMYVTQPIVRYSMAAPGGKLMIAIENPEDGFGTTSYDDQSYPDLTARYQINGKYGYYSIAGVARKLEHENGAGKKSSKETGAISLSARFPTIGKDDLRLQYNYGSLGRYMGLLTYPDVDLSKLTADDKVKPLKTFGATAAYRHFWSDNWRSTLSVSHTEVINSLPKLGTPIANGTLSYFDSSSSAHANLMWSAHKNLTLGVEYAYWDFGKITGGNKKYEQIMTSAILTF